MNRNRLIAAICRLLRQTDAIVHPGGKVTHIARDAGPHEVVSLTPAMLADIIAAAMEMREE